MTDSEQLRRIADVIDNLIGGELGEHFTAMTPENLRAIASRVDESALKLDATEGRSELRRKALDEALSRLDSARQAFTELRETDGDFEVAVTVTAPGLKLSEALEGGHSSTAEREPCGAFVSNDPDLHCRLANDHDGDHEWLARRDGKCSAESHELLRRAGEAAGLTHHTCGRCGESLDRAGEGQEPLAEDVPDPSYTVHDRMLDTCDCRVEDTDDPSKHEAGCQFRVEYRADDPPDHSGEEQLYFRGVPIIWDCDCTTETGCLNRPAGRRCIQFDRVVEGQ